MGANDGDARSGEAFGEGQHGRAEAAINELKRAIAGQDFGSLEEAQAYLDKITQQRNQGPVGDFQGLSPEHMYRFMHFPFDSPHFVTFADAPETAPAAPAMQLLALLIDAIGEKGVKATGKGNLPRNLVRSIGLAYLGEERYREATRFGEIQRETDALQLHLVRLTAEMAGFIRKYQGKFVVTKKCLSLCSKAGLAALYPPLFRVFATRMNWAYLGLYEELPVIQQTFLFTAYLLQCSGDEWRPDTFYEDAFLTAFPMALDEVQPRDFATPEHIVRSCYRSRAIHRFGVLLGLVETRPIGEERLYKYEVRKLPLLEEAVRFTL